MKIESILELPQEEGLKLLGDVVLGSVLKKGEDVKLQRAMLYGTLSPKLLRDENHIIYKVLYNFKEQQLLPDMEFVQLYLTQNKNVLREAKEYININDFADLHEDEELGYIAGVLKKYEKLLESPRLSEEDFVLYLEKYKLLYGSTTLGQAYNVARNILTEGQQLGRRKMHGYDDSVMYVKTVMSDIDALVDKTQGQGFIDSSASGLSKDDDIKIERIGGFDSIDELNEHFGGIYTSNFYSVSAPTKGGKSKFTTSMVYDIGVRNGHNVVVWAYEGGHKAWWAQLRAKHFYHTYVESQSGGKRINPTSQNEIFTGNFKDPHTEEIELLSATDLFSNPDYGTYTMIDRPFNVETFIDEIETAVKLSNAKVVLIDYLQLINWTTKSLSKSEAVGQAYQKLLSYAKKRNVAVITPAQFKQEFVKIMAETKPTDEVEVRTAGGESAEVVRTPDVNIALYATAEDIRKKSMSLLSIPSRMARPFPRYNIYADLQSCVFCTKTE